MTTTRSAATRRAAVVGLVTLLAATACSGPKAPFDIGTQAAPVDLVLGEREAVVEAPVGPFSVPLPREVPVIRDTAAAPSTDAPTTSTTAAPLGPCPPFDPLAPVAGGSDVDFTGKPQAGTYAYRAKTTETVGSQTTRFEGDSTWKITVGATDPSNNGTPVTIDVTVGPARTSRELLLLPQPTTTGPAGDPNTTDLNYQVVDQYNLAAVLAGLPRIDRNAPNLGRYGLAGIYLVSQTTGDSTFRPTVPIPLVQTPVSPGRSFQAVGTDGVTTMSFTSTTKKTEYVNACGTKVESILVDLSEGRIGGRTDEGRPYRLAFEESLFIGLQFGGIPVRDVGAVRSESDVLGGEKVERTFDFTANVQPKAAKR
jgi:hypothetical protein